MNQGESIRRHHRLVICTAMLGEPIIVDGCFVVDASTLTKFLDRQSIGVYVAGTMVRVTDPNYEGDITSEKLQNVLRESPPIQSTQKLLEPKWIELALGDSVVRFLRFEKIIPDYLALSDSDAQKVRNAFGIDPEPLGANK